MDLQTIARSEKASTPILELTENFYQVARAEISLQEQTALIADSEGEAMLIKEAVISAQRALHNLTAIRIKKVIKAAVSDAYRKERKHGNDFMQPTERALYDNIIVGILNIK
jgi:DNA replication initiation complex subunit (GINS family)